MSKRSWRLEGIDTFEGERYTLRDEDGEPIARDSEREILAAARAKLLEIEEDQPTESSGGQYEEHTIQDQLVVIRPDGTEYRFFDVQQADAYDE